MARATRKRPRAVANTYREGAGHAEPLGLPSLRFHDDLRHSHCTQLVDAGVRPDIVTERLGHASVAFTLA